MKLKSIISYILMYLLILNVFSLNVFALENVVDKDVKKGNIEIYKSNLIEVTSNSAIKVEFKITSQWDNAFNSNICIKNNSKNDIKNWQIEFEFPHEIQTIWNGKIISHEKHKYIINNDDWNKDINIGEEVNFGFTALKNNEIVEPINYKLVYNSSDDNNTSPDNPDNNTSPDNPDNNTNSNSNSNSSSSSDDEDIYDFEVKDISTDIVFSITSEWEDKFNGNIKIKNIGKSDIENWQIEFEFPHEIQTIWNGKIILNKDNKYIIKNDGWNKDIRVGQEINFGFTVLKNNEIIEPTNYRVFVDNDIVNEEDYSIIYKLLDNWDAGFSAQITIKNNSKKDIEEWYLDFDFDKIINTIWDAEIIAYADKRYHIKSKNYNYKIPAGQSITFGFNGINRDIINEPSNFKLKRGNNIIIMDSNYDKELFDKEITDFLNKLEDEVVTEEEIDRAIKKLYEFDKAGLLFNESPIENSKNKFSKEIIDYDKWLNDNWQKLRIGNWIEFCLDINEGVDLEKIQLIGFTYANEARDLATKEFPNSINNDSYRHFSWNYIALSRQKVSLMETRIVTINHEWGLILIPYYTQLIENTYNNAIKEGNSEEEARRKAIGEAFNKLQIIKDYLIRICESKYDKYKILFSQDCIMDLINNCYGRAAGYEIVNNTPSKLKLKDAYNNAINNGYLVIDAKNVSEKEYRKVYDWNWYGYLYEDK